MSHETPRGVNGQASDQASWWARPALAPWEDKSTARHTEVARSAQSHSQAPPPILASTTTQNQQPNTHRSARKKLCTAAGPQRGSGRWFWLARLGGPSAG